MKISLCMIIKNEEKNLYKCLNAVKGKVDEVIVVDTGSNDSSKKIAMEFTDKVFDFTWCNDFSAARNYSIEQASNNWVLVLDADEIITEFDSRAIMEFIEGDPKRIGRIKRVDLFEDETGIKRYLVRINRLFNKEYYKYDGIFHEQVMSKYNGEISSENVAIIADHIGYMKEVLIRTDKIARNLDMLDKAIQKKDNDPYLYYQLGKTFFMAKRHSEAVASFEKALKLGIDFRLEYAMDLVESYGYSLINSSQYQKAMEIFRFEQYYAGMTDFLFLKGIIYMNNAKFSEAVECFSKCIGNKEGNMDGLNSYLPSYNIGVIYECLGFKKEASEYYLKCGDYIPARKRLSNMA